MGSWDRARPNPRTFDALNAPIAAFVVGDGDGVSEMRDTRLFYALVPRRGAFTTTVRALSPCQEAWHAAPRPLSSSFKLEWILTSPVFEGHTLTHIDIFYF